MNNERLFSLGNPWFRISVGTTIIVAVVSALIGFVWLPSAQKDAPFQGIWNAICSAAGVPQKWLAGGEPVTSTVRTSTAEITPHRSDVVRRSRCAAPCATASAA